MYEFLNSLSFDIDRASLTCMQIRAMINSILAGDTEDTDNIILQISAMRSLVQGLRGELDNLNDNVRNAMYTPFDDTQNIQEASSEQKSTQEGVF